MAASAISRDLRPKRSVSGPATSAPAAAPSDAPATRYPVAKLDKWYGMKPRAEPMLDVS